MNDSPIPRSVRELINEKREVLGVIAVALLVLTVTGFAVAVELTDRNIAVSYMDPVEPAFASIDANPEQDSLQLTVEDFHNVDELNIRHEGSKINAGVGELGANVGNSTIINYGNGTNQLDVREGDQIHVVAVELPENRRVVYEYTVPENVSV